MNPSNSRDNALWQQCWRDRQTDFHQAEVNPHLARFWPGLGLAAGSRVFVPLCGKSLDMLWLANQGHEVIGLELSPVAVDAFFRENGLQPARHSFGAFTLWQQGNIRILCGDFFAAGAADLGPIDAVYDRAALTALPEDIRRPYVAHLKQILPAACKLFLLTVEDAEEGETEAQSRAIADEVSSLYAADFEIELAHVDSVLESDPGGGPPLWAEHKVYRLTPRAIRR